eukprot:g4458.t1
MRSLSKRSRERAGNQGSAELPGGALHGGGDGAPSGISGARQPSGSDSTATAVPAASKGSLLVQVMRENKSLRHELESAIATVASLRDEVNSCRARESALQDVVNQSAAEIEVLRARVSELEEDLEQELESQLEMEKEADGSSSAQTDNSDPSNRSRLRESTHAVSDDSSKQSGRGSGIKLHKQSVATGPSAAIPSPRSLSGQKTLFLAGSRRKLVHSGKNAPPAPAAGIEDRPRFSNSANYHDPNDHEHDYSQSRSASRVTLLEAVHTKTAPRPAPQRKIVPSEKIAAIEKCSSTKKLSLYEAALTQSPMKVMPPSKRDVDAKLSHTGKSVLNQIPEQAKPHPLRFHRRHTSIEGDRHSYHHHHHNIGADGFFQSVKNTKEGMVPKKLAHLAARDQGSGSRDVRSDGDSGGASKNKGSFIIEPHYRESLAKTAASGRGKSSPRDMAFGRRRESVTARDSHMTLHQNLSARDFMVGGGVKSAEPTYNRVLPGAELDQEREMKMKDMKKAGRQER